MKIAQIVLAGASGYERKSQRIDAAALTAAGHEVIATTSDTARQSGADLVHVYGPAELPRREFVGFPLSYVASGTFLPPRFAFRRPIPPRVVISPVNGEDGRVFVPESVEEDSLVARNRVASSRGTYTIGVVDGSRPGVASLVDRTRHRIARTRDDVVIKVFHGSPPNVDFGQCDAWIDPAAENDFDGMTAEAVCAGLVVIATRTALNQQRLEQGRTGFLVPLDDPNEMTHAILAALFKPEVAEQKRQSARQTISKWKPRQRLRALLAVYGSLIK